MRKVEEGAPGGEEGIKRGLTQRYVVAVLILGLLLHSYLRYVGLAGEAPKTIPAAKRVGRVLCETGWGFVVIGSHFWGFLSCIRFPP
jgi:hypothetical protein